MKMASLPILITLAAAILPMEMASAVTPLKENFNGETLRSSRWKITNHEEGRLVHFPGGLRFTVKSNPNENALGVATLRNRQPRCHKSWEVIVDVVNHTDLGYRVGVGLQICNASDASDRVNYLFNGAGPGGIGSNSGFAATGQADDEVDLNDFGREFRRDPQVAAGSMRVTFDSKTQHFTFWYDRSGREDGFQWVMLSTYSITGKGGYRRGNWKMSPADGRFTLQIYGYSMAHSVPAGQLKLDNFSLKNIR